ncbi:MULTISPECIES: MAPEG family protein [Microvirga]|uniref:MAPEG family protein n=1 Tax=Microvirga TaxID=186650 RepID=UPI001D000B94|nr:MAPEG family protein [Microvirga lenta]MCB5176821.1 MAPEG family protein [Microvirga lenta]
MSVTSILLPVFVQVALTFFLLFWMGRSRISVIRSGEVKVKDIALGERNWPRQTQQVVNTFHNQFELPVLFYVLVALALVTRKADLTFVVLSWLYVATRLVHAYIYATVNKVSWRFQVFLIGALILMLMWVIFAVQIFAAEAAI